MAFYRTPEDLVTQDQIDQAIASVIKSIQSIDPVTLSAIKHRGVSMAAELNVDGTHDRLNVMATYTDHRRMAAYFITMLSSRKPDPDKDHSDVLTAQ
jgi:hypothetical protein